MGTWDEVCVLCGAAPGAFGPPHLCPGYRLDQSASQLAKEIQTYDLVDLQHDELVAILTKVCAAHHDLWELTLPLDEEELNYRDFTQFWREDAFVIGHFGFEGRYDVCKHSERELHPTGEGVAIRHVCCDSGGAWFENVVATERGQRIIDNRMTRYNSGTFNTWVHIPCFKYLEAWLDCPLSPRMGRSAQPLGLANEMYELVRSRKECITSQGHLPCVEYYGSLGAFDDRKQWWLYAIGCRDGMYHTAKAIRDGLRGDELVALLLEDSKYWMFAEPYWYPPALPDVGHEWIDTSIADSAMDQSQAAVCMLPLELLPDILQHLELKTMFALGASCKLLYGRVFDRSTLTWGIRRSLTNADGPMRWMYPLASFRREWDFAWNAMWTWMPKEPQRLPVILTFKDMKFSGQDSDDDYVPDDGWADIDDTSDFEDEDDTDESDAESDGPDEGFQSGVIHDVPLPAAPEPPDPDTLPLKPLPLFEPDFPLLAFLRAWYLSDNMRARRRRWNIIKQFDILWTNYRRDGWERDEFVPPGTVWTEVDGHLTCSHPA